MSRDVEVRLALGRSTARQWDVALREANANAERRYRAGRSEGFDEATFAALTALADVGSARLTIAMVVARLAIRALVLDGMPLPGWAEREKLEELLAALYLAGPPLTPMSVRGVEC